MVGTGEYTTGFGAGKTSDKSAGVVALTMCDLRRRELVGRLHLAGVNGAKLPAIREHIRTALAGQYPKSFPTPEAISMSTYPPDGTVDAAAYRVALDALPAGSAVVIFTPDDTHFDIAMECIRRGHHVLVTKPIVKTLEQHLALRAAAAEHNVLVAVEVHKRWDPIYADARDRMRALGDFSFMSAYMSQPKAQLGVFRDWAGRSSDISFYLNSHHVDFTEWCIGDRARPVSVVARASTGVAAGLLGRPCEDSITLLVTWLNLGSGTTGVATYTASWAAPRSDVHSQQRFFCMTHGGEVTVDQAHRGYTVATDASGFASCNPLFMRYTPDDGKFVGQHGYGYRSFEAFISAVRSIQAGEAVPSDFEASLATVNGTLQGTAILEAGRRSLDAGGAEVELLYDAADEVRPECAAEVVGAACEGTPEIPAPAAPARCREVQLTPIGLRVHSKGRSEA